MAEHEAFLEAAKANPDVKVAGDLYGMWTGAVAKSEMLKFLGHASASGRRGVVDGQHGGGVGQALEQAGRPVTIVTDVTNQCSFLAFWKGHKFSSLTMAQDGGPTGYEAFVPAIRIMSGQKPKVNTIFFPLPIITNDNIDDYYDPSMTVQSTCFRQRQGSPPGHRRLL